MPPKVQSTIIDGIDDTPKDKGEKLDNGEFEFKGKLKKSSFMITINTEKAKNKVDEAFEKKFQAFNDFLFKGDRILKYLHCKQCNKGNCVGNAGCIQDVRLLTKLEYGGKVHRLHSHCSLWVIHTGSVQVDIDKVKKLAYRFFGYKLWIKVRGSPDIAYSREVYLLEKHGEL